MEYGLHASVRLYSGGLGVLAGDFLKEASDSNVDMTAVGLLYTAMDILNKALPLMGIKLTTIRLNALPKCQFSACSRDAQWRLVKDSNWDKRSFGYC